MKLTPEYRRCPITGRTVVLAPERAERPIARAYTQPHHRDSPGNGFCPFCPKNEHETPPELFALRDASTWQLRVVPNKFPAVRSDCSAFGYHEVFIESHAHSTNPTDLNDEQFANIFRAYRSRLIHHHADPAIQSVSIFKNVGAEAGASQAHTHSQLIALPFVYPDLKLELSGSQGSDCPYCVMMHEPARTVIENEFFVAITPYAPRFSYEMWVLPKNHQSRFEECRHDRELSTLLRAVLKAMDRVLYYAAYNWYLHTAPKHDVSHYHWHLEIVPRTSRVAGFEWGSGVFINDIFPERAAQKLRDKLTA